MKGRLLPIDFHGDVALRIVCFFVLATVFMVNAVFARDSVSNGDTSFECGGHLESKVWRLWDSDVRADLQAELVEFRLKSRGDTAALYDMQGYLGNLASMAHRCGRRERLKELNAFVSSAFPVDQGGRSLSGSGWVCRDGAACENGSHLHNKEVALHSVQFLGFLSTLAVYSSGFEDVESVEFVESAFTLSLGHLIKWAKASRFSDGLPVMRKIDSTRTELFTDKQLWMLVIYTRVSALLEKRPQLMRLIPDKTGTLKLLAEHASVLEDFMDKRISFSDAVTTTGARERLADLDAGKWSRFRDNRYAGYRGSLKPVRCVSGQPEVLVPHRDDFIVSDLGWDFSHARRLVHAADAFLDDGEAARRVLGLRKLPGDTFFKGISTRIVRVVWNGSLSQPLFSNYLSGANGWYRAGYSAGKGRCHEGFEPYGLSFSFAHGGYAALGRLDPRLKEVGRRIFLLLEDKRYGADDDEFVSRFYPAFHSTATAKKRMRAQLMFWPSLVD